MRTNAIVRIVLFSIAILVLLCILGVGIAADTLMANHNWLFTEQEGTASSTGSVDADTIRNLSIEWGAGSITVCRADVNEITLTETGARDHEPMVWLQSGDTLKVASVKEDSYLRFGSIPSKDLLIEVPRDWNCDTLEVETAAANLEVSSLSISKVDFDGASGKFRFHNCAVDALDIDTASGDIQFTGTLNQLDFDGASADCEITLSNCPDQIQLDMASGDLDLTLPGDCGFTASLDALSGHLDSDFDVTRTSDGFRSGDGACRIDISAMSGSIYIHKGSEAKNCDH